METRESFNGNSHKIVAPRLRNYTLNIKSQINRCVADTLCVLLRRLEYTDQCLIFDTKFCVDFASDVTLKLIRITLNSRKWNISEMINMFF